MEQCIFISDFRLINTRVKRRPFQIHQIQDLLLKLEEDGTVKFISDFRQLNIRIKRKTFPNLSSTEFYY
jgi:hypothetical protein